MGLRLELVDFRISGLGLRLGEKGLGLATMGLDYISDTTVSIWQIILIIWC